MAASTCKVGVVFDMQFAGLMHQKDLGKINCSILYIGYDLLMQGSCLEVPGIGCAGKSLSKINYSVFSLVCAQKCSS